MRYPTGPRRYHLVRLVDGRIYATDNTNTGRAYFLVPRPARQARYALARSGEVLVDDGRVSGVSGTAHASGYIMVGMADGSVRLQSTQDPGRTLVVAKTGGLSPRGHFAVLDARDGTLLLLDEKGIHELTVNPTSPLHSPSGNPIYQYADDFAP